jgi:hypothetical protein
VVQAGRGHVMLEGDAFGGHEAEKLAAELLWHGKKMAVLARPMMYEAMMQFGATP